MISDHDKNGLYRAAERRQRRAHRRLVRVQCALCSTDEQIEAARKEHARHVDWVVELTKRFNWPF